MNNSPVIQVDGLSKTYRDGVLRRRSVEALREATFSVGSGEIFGLLGPNGAGKTTLIKILLGIVRKSSGEATMLDRPAGDRAARRRIGYLPEHPRIPPHLRGDTALEYYGGLSGLPASEVRRRRPELLKTVNLAGWERTPVRKYSKGMLQRLGLAQAMLHGPELLILDEPTDGVDPVGRAEIRDVLKRLQGEGRTVFLNSHLLQEVELVCDRVAILDGGRVKRVGGVGEITEQFGGKAETELVLNLEGEEAVIREALGVQQPTTWKPAGENRYQVGMPVRDQAQVDGLNDALRQRGVRIYSMTRRRLTLEEAFIEIVREGEQSP